MKKTTVATSTNNNNNKHSVIAQSRIWEGRMYADLTTTLKVEKLSPIDPHFKIRKTVQSRIGRNNVNEYDG